MIRAMCPHLLIKPIPDTDISVAAACSECVEAGVEADGIHWIYELNIVLFHAMTLESKLLLLNFSIIVEILNSNSSFD